MPAGELLTHEREKGFELRRFVHRARRVQRDQPRIAADLAKLGERVEDGDRRSGDAFHSDGATDIRVRRDADRLVEFPLLRAELHRGEELGLGRELARHIALEPAENVRRDRRAERGEPGLVAVVFNRPSPEPPERKLVAEQSGHEPIEERPQLAQVVFDGRSREADAVLGRDAFEGAAGLAARVLDRLRFVEDRQMKAELREAFFVADQDRVRRNDHVRAGDLLPARAPSRAVKDEDAEMRSKLGDFSRPVADESCRRDDQRRCVQPPGLVLDANVRNRLERFAEPHFVGQDGPFSSLAQALKETDPLGLVRAEGRLEAAGRLQRFQRRCLRKCALGQPRGVCPRDGPPPL